MAVSTCIGRLGPPGCPQGCQRLRDDGVPAPQTLATLQGLRQEAWAKGKGLSKGAIQRIAPRPARPRSQQSPGRDPLPCPHCQSVMEVWRLWPPPSGVIQEEVPARRRGKEAAQAPRADPTGHPGRTVGPAAGGIPRSLSGRRGRDGGP